MAVRGVENSERESLADWLKVSESGIRIQQPDICRNVKEFLAWRPPGLNSVNFMLLTRLIDRKSLAAVVELVGWVAFAWFWLLLAQSGNICQRATKARHLLIKLRKIAPPRGDSNQTISTFSCCFPHPMQRMQLKSVLWVRWAKLLFIHMSAKSLTSAKHQIKKQHG